MAITQRLTPNCAPREAPINYIVLHCTEVSNDEDALAVYADPRMELSCHYYISYAGETLQLVKDEDTAWHAGASVWQNIEKLNHHSLGIEIANPGEQAAKPFTQKQYEALEDLLAALMARHDIPPENILGHSDIATWRKQDPGRHFDWRHLEQKGLAAPFKAPEATTDPLDALYHWGYHGESSDVLAAFQRRYLPENVTGTLCEKTRAFILGAE